MNARIVVVCAGIVIFLLMLAVVFLAMISVLRVSA